MCYTLIVVSCLLGCQSTNSISPRKLSVDLRWIRSTLDKDHLGFRYLHRSSPVIYKDMILQANSIDGLAALNKDNGNFIWKAKVDQGVDSQPTVHNDRVYFGGNDGFFYCADINTGKTIWKFDTRAETLASPIIYQNQIYFLAGNNVVHALDINTGKSIWRYNRINTSPISVRGGTKPAIKSNRLYIGFADGFVAALNTKDGNLIWERQLNTKPKFKDVDGTPIIHEDRLFISSFDDALYALSLSDGQVLWRIDEGGSTPVTVEGDKIFYSTSTGSVLGLDLKSGREIWRHKIKNGLGAQPSIWDNQLLVSISNGPLLILNKMDGKVLKSYAPGYGSFATPAFDKASNRIWLVSNSGNLHSLYLSWKKSGLYWDWEK